jgi:hypothetical protein
VLQLHYLISAYLCIADSFKLLGFGVNDPATRCSQAIVRGQAGTNARADYPAETRLDVAAQVHLTLIHTLLLH